MLDFKALLFDLDGTLLDTAPDFITSLNIQLGRHNRAEMPATEVRAGVTNGSAGLIRHAFSIDPEHPELEPLRQEFLDIYYNNLADQTALFDGMHSVLQTCGQSNIPWGIVTNKPWKYTRAVLEALGLLDNASTIICPDHVQQTKPHPESILLACREIDIAPADCIYVGDHLRDIEAGRSAGTRTVAAAWGYISKEDNIAQWQADWILSQPTHLHPLMFKD